MNEKIRRPVSPPRGLCAECGSRYRALSCNLPGGHADASQSHQRNANAVFAAVVATATAYRAMLQACCFLVT